MRYNKKHGHTHIGGKRKLTRTYISWQQMKQRAFTGTAINAKDYKERGILACERWANSFENFLSDMGERPEGKSLDRINNNEGYHPQNCKWSTKKEQLRNTRITRFLTIEGITKSRSEWAEFYNIENVLVAARIRCGWEALKALTTPKFKKGKYSFISINGKREGVRL